MEYGNFCCHTREFKYFFVLCHRILKKSAVPLFACATDQSDSNLEKDVKLYICKFTVSFWFDKKIEG
jgi:hypothetical protein